jgi:hypothetical protein
VLNINEFFSAFSQEEKYFLNLPVLWSVTIDGVAKNDINKILKDGGEKWTASVDPGSYTKSGNILVAQEITLPRETSTFDAYPSGDNTGGFLPGYGLNVRSNFLDRGLTVNFLETQVDIEHNFFKPWLIAVGIKGLIAKGVNLKANMSVKQYSNSGKFIKGFKFNKVFPTAIEGYTLNYDNTDFKVKSITFGCQNYEQI